MSVPPLLFSQFDMFSVLENQKVSMRKEIAVASQALAARPDDEVLDSFVKKFSVEVPTLKVEQISTSDQEIDVDVSRDPRRFIRDASPFYIKGTEISVHIPFTGEYELFEARPSTFTLSPPRGEIRKSELLLVYSFPNDMPPPDLKGQIDRDVKEIENNLASLRSMAAALEGELHQIATATWQRRKAEFSVRADVISGLGLPRKNVETSNTSHTPTPAQSGTGPVKPTRRSSLGKPTRTWHAFICHASEDKLDIAKPLADALIATGLKVWYDDYTLTVGDSLRQKIDEGLSKSEYGVVILSKAFFSKHWPQQELNGLAAREEAGRKVILPVWHNLSKDDVMAHSPILADKLGVPTALGIDNVARALLSAMNKQVG